MAVSYIASTSGHNELGSTLSFSFAHTITSGTTNPFLVVAIAANNNWDSAQVTGVSCTYNGDAMTKQLEEYRANAGNVSVLIYTLVNPDVGSSYNVAFEVTTSSSTKLINVAYGATSFGGVSQTTPFRTPTSAEGTNTSWSISPASLVGDIVYAFSGSAPNQTLSLNGSETEAWSQHSDDGARGIAGYESGADTSTNMAFAITSFNRDYVVWGAAIIPFTGSSSVSPSVSPSASVSPSSSASPSLSPSASQSPSSSVSPSQSPSSSVSPSLSPSASVSPSSSESPSVSPSASVSPSSSVSPSVSPSASVSPSSSVSPSLSPSASLSPSSSESPSVSPSSSQSPSLSPSASVSPSSSESPSVSPSASLSPSSSESPSQSPSQSESPSVSPSSSISPSSSESPSQSPSESVSPSSSVSPSVSPSASISPSSSTSPSLSPSSSQSPSPSISPSTSGSPSPSPEAIAVRDDNGVPAILGVNNMDGESIAAITANPTTHLMDCEDGTSGSDLSTNENAQRDANYIPTLIAVSEVDGTSPVLLYVDFNGKLLIDSQ